MPVTQWKASAFGPRNKIQWMTAIQITLIMPLLFHGKDLRYYTYSQASLETKSPLSPTHPTKCGEMLAS